jgi:glucose/arabinose dehydrogenase
MLGLALIPGSSNEAVVITQDGFLYRILLDDSTVPSQFGDVSGLITAGGEEGLLGIAFSPAFQTDGRVYLYYTRGSPQPSVLSRFQVVGGVLDENSEEVLLEIPQPGRNHNGGQLMFGPDGHLYLGLGDGGGQPSGNSQNLGTLLGKILRVDVSGEDIAIPDDNPVADTDGARPEIYAYGLRNPWRFSFDRETGEMWAGDVGQNLWEEVNRIVAGGNYGWNIMEGPTCLAAASCNRDGLEMPRAVYGPDGGCSITGGYVYRGSSMPELNGWYVYGDYCSGNIWALDTGATTDPILLAATGLSIPTFAELPDGELLVVTFDNAIYRLERAG